MTANNSNVVWHNSGRRARKTTALSVDYRKLNGGDDDDDFDLHNDDYRPPGVVPKTKQKKPKFVLNPHIAKVVHRNFDDPATAIFTVDDGRILTADSLRKSRDGLCRPLLITDHYSSLDMKIPDSNLTVRDIGNCIGMDYPVNVMDSSVQEELHGWTMRQLVEYFEDSDRILHSQLLQERISSSGGKNVSLDSKVGSNKKFPRILNQISLEFSNTPLRQYARSPKFVRDLDWIDIAWPEHRRGQVECTDVTTANAATEDYPRVQYYCLTSTAGCYTDFHVDFGGTSVWYHVSTGRKTFLLIPPTPDNLKAYEGWLCSANQSKIFFADKAKGVFKLSLEAGQTLIIPSGYIHAVYTPIDSIVFGGNFLHSLDMSRQLDVHCLETRTRVLQKFRFPFFVQMMFYAGARLLKVMREDSEGLCDREIDGMPRLIEALRLWYVAPGGDAGGRGSVAEAAQNAALIAGCEGGPMEMINEIESMLSKILSCRKKRLLPEDVGLPNKKTKLKLNMRTVSSSSYERTRVCSGTDAVPTREGADSGPPKLMRGRAGVRTGSVRIGPAIVRGSVGGAGCHQGSKTMMNQFMMSESCTSYAKPVGVSSKTKGSTRNRLRKKLGIL